jgi:hypothetical protein
MTVYVTWTPELAETNLPGPWTEIRVAAPGLLLIESDDTQAARPLPRHPELALGAHAQAVRSGADQPVHGEG